MKKALSLFLLVVLVFSFSVMPASAAAKIDYIFPRREYYTADFYTKQDTTYIVPENSVVRIEEGATLYIDGDFQVKGTLKNYGTIVIRDITRASNRADIEQLNERGHLAVSGELYNYGNIKVISASIECGYTGFIKNDGTITLKNETDPNLILFRVTSYKNSSGGVQKGEVENTKKGVINLFHQVGMGMVLSEDAKLVNNGSIIGLG